MTVKEFAERHIKGEKMPIMKIEYLPIVNKINLCERVINATYYKKNEDGTKSLHIDSVSEHILFQLAIVDAYTNINIDFTHVIEEYDMLDRDEVLQEIWIMIPSREVEELKQMLAMKEKDIIQNEYEPHAFIANQVERFGTLVGVAATPVLEKLAEVIENVDVEKLAKVLEQADKADNNKILKLFK